MITLIAAASENNALGYKGDLLWHLPDDFKRFKALTTGHCIIMGRKTFETFPKPLPNRKHIIITRDKNYKSDFGEVVHNLDEALEIAKTDDTPYIIGGGEIYHIGIERADAIELTRVHHTFETTDAFFPKIDLDMWELVNSEYHSKDDRHQYDFTYETYRRKNNKQ